MRKIVSRGGQVLKYLVSGGVAAACEYGAFLALHYGVSLDIAVSQIVSFGFGLLVAFSLHVLWTFNDRSAARQSVPSRFLLYVLLAFINIVATSILIIVLHKITVAPWLAKLIVMICVATWNYAILNKFIFSSELARLFTKERLRKFYGESKASLVLFLLITLLGVVLAVSVPLGGGHDEIAHVIKADATTRLDLLPKEHKFIDVDGKQAKIYTHKVSRNLWDYAAHAFNTRNSEPTRELRQTLQEKKARPYNSEIIAVDAWGAAGYSSIAYIPNAIGLVVAKKANLSVAGAMYAARISAVIFFAAVVCAAHWILRKHKARLIVYAVVLFPPITITFSAISADGFVSAASILLGAIILRSVLDKRDLSQYLRWLAISLAIIAPTIKLPYIIISMLVAATPIIPGGGKRKGVFAAMFIAAVVIVGVSWTKAMQGPNELQSQRVSCCTSPASPKDQVKYVISHPIEAISTTFSSMLSDNTFEGLGMVVQYNDPKKTMDRELILLYIVVMILIASMCSVEIRSVIRQYPRLYFFMGISILATIGLIYAALYVAATSVGQHYIWGVQARYFLPLTMLAMITLSACFSWIQSIRVTTSQEKWVMGILAVTHAVTIWAFINNLSV